MNDPNDDDEATQLVCRDLRDRLDALVTNFSNNQVVQNPIARRSYLHMALAMQAVRVEIELSRIGIDEISRRKTLTQAARAIIEREAGKHRQRCRRPGCQESLELAVFEHQLLDRYTVPEGTSQGIPPLDDDRSATLALRMFRAAIEGLQSTLGRDLRKAIDGLDIDRGGNPS